MLLLPSERRFSSLCPKAMARMWKKAELHLSKSDSRLAELIKLVGPCRLKISGMLSPFAALAESIVYQQLTGKAAATIYGRVTALFDGAEVSPKGLLAIPHERLRMAGLSNAKALAMRDLATKTQAGVVPSLSELEQMSNEAIVECLTEVRGIGKWTVEMLLIFRLGRPDVLPVTDYGIRKGFTKVWRKRKLVDPGMLAKQGERWAPFRSVASWYLWRALDIDEARP